jgi:hypothetical protein
MISIICMRAWYAVVTKTPRVASAKIGFTGNSEPTLTPWEQFCSRISAPGAKCWPAIAVMLHGTIRDSDPSALLRQVLNFEFLQYRKEAPEILRVSI